MNKSNLDRLFVRKDLTIKGAMKQMDITARKILFVTDKNRKLFGTITDGDIRRWILADGDLNQTVEKIYNRKAIYVKKGISGKEKEKKMLKAGPGAVPIVDNDLKIVDVLFLQDIIKDAVQKDKNRSTLKIPVIIMAGGYGSRLDPFTKILPKALIPVEDKPVVEIIIDNFLKYVSGGIYLILGYKREMIKSYFDNCATDYGITYINEGAKPLGTAGGLRLIPEDFPETFFLSNCDTIINARYDDIYNFHKEKNYDMTIIGSMQHHTLPYGVMGINAGGGLKEIEEKPEYDFLVNTGMYVIEKRILRHIDGKKVFHITDLIKKIKKKKGRIGVYPVSEKSWLDVGKWESYRETTKDFFAKQDE